MKVIFRFSIFSSVRDKIQREAVSNKKVREEKKEIIISGQIADDPLG